MDEKKMSSGGDITSLSDECFIRLSVGDSLEVKISDYSGTGAGNYHEGRLNLVRIGD